MRQKAARELLTTGAAARDSLAAVAESADPEARAAARRLVMLIDKAEFSRQLEAFAADTNGQRGLTLPGWNQYRELVGDDPSARALFVEMQRHESALLADVFDQRAPSRKQAWEDRLLRIVRWPATPNGQLVTPSVGTCATMIFLGSTAEPGISDQAATYLPNLMQRPPLQPALGRADARDPVRRLVAAWVVECPNRSASAIAQRINVARSLNMSEAMPFALNVALSEPGFVTVHPELRAQALVLVAQSGGPEDVEKLEQLLDDETVVRRFGNPAQPGQEGQVQREVQIRDLALIAMLKLTEQDPAEYGYGHARQQSQQMLDPGSVFPESDEARAAAIAKWRSWKAARNHEAAKQERVN